MNRTIINNKNKINELCLKHNVKSLYLFGSAVYSDENEDFDFLINFKEMDFPDYADNFLGIAEVLEKLLSKKVDLITEKSLSNPYFIESVNKSRTLLYENN
jgi:predicted nucleotidyltransferase